MSKIGIISMQRVHNYGSFMQCYALKKIIENLGHECVFVDIKPGRFIVTDDVASFRDVNHKFDKYIFARIHNFIDTKRMMFIFPKYLRTVMNIKKYNTSEKCDIIVIGSDEVFNCTQKNTRYGFSPHLFGQNTGAKKVITYAASFGSTDMTALKYYKIENEVACYLREITRISVRDKNSECIVRQLIGIQPEINVDPAIIGDYDDKVRIPKMDNYIAIYAYSNRINNMNEIQAIKDFAKRNNLKTIAIGMHQIWCDRSITVDPFTVVGYIKKAKYVVTDTFHGCVFSIKYNKQFAVYIRNSNNYKISDLLCKFNLEDRVVHNYSDLADILYTVLPIDKINETIDMERRKSLEYLSNNLG